MKNLLLNNQNAQFIDHWINQVFILEIHLIFEIMLTQIKNHIFILEIIILINVIMKIQNIITANNLILN